LMTTVGREDAEKQLNTEPQMRTVHTRKNQIGLGLSQKGKWGQGAAGEKDKPVHKGRE